MARGTSVYSKLGGFSRNLGPANFRVSLMHLGCLQWAATLGKRVSRPRGDISFYDVKGALEAAIDAMKLGPVHFEQADVKHLRKGQAAKVLLRDGVAIGTLGRLSEEISASYKFRQPVYVAELDLTALLASEERLCSTNHCPGILQLFVT